MSALSQNPPDFNYDALCKFEVMKSDKFTFVVEIPDFSLRTEKQGESLFEKFSVNGPGSKTTNLQVRVFPKGLKTQGRDVKSTFIGFANASDEDVRGKYSFAVVDYRNGNKIKNREYCGKIEAKKGMGFEFSDQHAVNDILKIVFEITVFGDSKKTMQGLNGVNRTELLSKNFHQDQLTNDLDLLFNSKEYADFAITCGGKVFECHKVILASRSPVFKSMFESNMREQHTGKLEIKNMAPEVLENLLLYIYTGNVPSIDRLSKELLAAADQYQVEKLKALCEIKLCAEMGIENCVYLLMLGDMHQALTLKAQALRFLTQNMDMINISECKKALISNPTLLFEVMENTNNLPTKSANNKDGCLLM